jgi:hypothetical protein
VATGDGLYYGCKTVVPSFLDKNINPTQAAAIEHVVFEKHRIWYDFTKGDMWTQLSGLKTLSVIVKSGQLSDTTMSSNTPFGTVALHESKKLRYTSAKVGVELDLPWHLKGSLEASTVRDIRAWQRHMETGLSRLREKALITEERQLAEEEAKKKQRATLRSTRGLRKL